MVVWCEVKNWLTTTTATSFEEVRVYSWPHITDSIDGNSIIHFISLKKSHSFELCAQILCVCLFSQNCAFHLSVVCVCTWVVSISNAKWSYNCFDWFPFSAKMISINIHWRCKLFMFFIVFIWAVFFVELFFCCVSQLYAYTFELNGVCALWNHS